MAISIKKSGNFIPGNKIRFSGTGGGGFKTFLTAPLPVPTLYLDSNFLSLATGSSGKNYISGYFSYPDVGGSNTTYFDKGQIWKIGSDNIVSGTVLGIYEDLGETIIASRREYPTFSLNTSDGNLAFAGSCEMSNYLGFLGGDPYIPCLWKLDTVTNEVSSTLLGGPDFSFLMGFAEKNNGDLAVASINENSILLQTIDSTGTISSTYINPLSGHTVYSYSYDAYNNNTNLISVDRKTDNIWVLGEQSSISRVRGASSVGYATASIWKITPTEVSGTLLTLQNAVYSSNPVDICFGNDDEMWVGGVFYEDSNNWRNVVWSILTGSGYVSSTLLPDGYSSSVLKIISSSYDGSIRALSVSEAPSLLLWTTYDSFASVSSTYIDGSAYSGLDLSLDSSGDVWMSSFDDSNGVKKSWKIDKTTGDVTRYLLDPPPGGTGVTSSGNNRSGFKIVPGDSKVYAHIYTYTDEEFNYRQVINLWKTNSDLSAVNNVKVGHVQNTWTSNLTRMNSNNIPYGDYTELSWNAYHAQSVDLKVYNTDSLGWDLIESNMNDSTSSYYVYQGYGTTKKYKFVVNPQVNYLATNHIESVQTSLYWDSLVDSLLTGSGGSIWVLGDYTIKTQPQQSQPYPYKKTVLWNVSSDNSISGSILFDTGPNDDWVSDSRNLYQRLVYDSSRDIFWTFGNKNQYSMLWNITGSTGINSGTILPESLGPMTCITLSGSSVWLAGYDVAADRASVCRFDSTTLEVSGTLIPEDASEIIANPIDNKPLVIRVNSQGDVWVLKDPVAKFNLTNSLSKIDGVTYEVSGTNLAGSDRSYGAAFDILFSGSNEDVWVLGTRFTSGVGSSSNAAIAWRLDQTTGDVSSTYLPVKLGVDDLPSRPQSFAMAENGDIYVAGIYTSSSISVEDSGNYHRGVLWRMYGSPLQVSSTFLHLWGYPEVDVAPSEIPSLSLSNVMFDSTGDVFVAGMCADNRPGRDRGGSKYLWKFDVDTLEISASFLYSDYYYRPQEFNANTTGRFSSVVDSSDKFYFLSIDETPPIKSGKLSRVNSSGAFISSASLAVTGGYGL